MAVPEETKKSSDGLADLAIFPVIGSPTATFTDVQEGDGASFISAIKLCRKDSTSKVISGMQFTSTSTVSMRETIREVEGFKGTDCSLGFELVNDDCI